MSRASNSSGVKVFSIQGRLYRERERLTGMTDEERQWRAQWIRDQRIPLEKVRPYELYKELNNPIDRAFRFPLNLLYWYLRPKIGHSSARCIRNSIGGMGMIGLMIYVSCYYFKYNANDWTRKGGFRVTTNRPAVLPFEEGFPAVNLRTKPSDYASRGFENSPI